MGKLYNGCTSPFTEALVENLSRFSLIHTTQMSMDPTTGTESLIIAFTLNEEDWTIIFEDTKKDLANAYCLNELCGTLSEEVLVQFLNNNLTFYDYLTK